jgi:hypothetical protein
MISLAIRLTFQVRTIISKGEEGFGEAYAAGKAMPEDQAIELALDQEQPADALVRSSSMTWASVSSKVAFRSDLIKGVGIRLRR